jgi:glycosyltransferase involved in cell wall biosynthesis
MRSNAIGEFEGRAVGAVLKRFLSNGDSSGVAFALAGFASRKWLHDADIFHVRSGAGQGGAIHTARRNGLRILTDHSIAHPAYIDDVLGQECQRLGLSYENWAGDGLWTRVMRDCDEADRVLVNSHFVKRTFIEKGFPAEVIDVAYLGVNERFYSLKKDYSIDGPVRLLFTGNFELRKGVATLLDAVRVLRKGGMDVRLRFVGNLPNSAPCLRARDAEFFTHTPFVPPDELRSALAAADLFVFPTLVEGSSRSAMEAAAAGLPVITTENCGLPLEGGKEVIYVPPSNPEALASAIACMASDERLRSNIGRNAASRIQRQFSWNHYGPELIRIYSTLLQ